MNKKNFIPRIIVTPFIMVVLLLAMLILYFKWLKNWFLYGGEIIVYQDINERKTVSELYFLMKRDMRKSTGFKDIKGKEIFDGDILSHKYESDEGIKTSRQQVFWSEKYGQWRLDNSHKQDKSFSSSLWTELRDYDYEIVGNIHEQK